MRFSSTIVVVSLLVLRTADARADGEGIVQPKASFWKSGPAGGAFGLFVEGGATAGAFWGLAGTYPFGAGSLGLGVSLRWFEASVNGYYGSTFDDEYSGEGFLGRVAARLPVNHVAFSLGLEVGYLTIPGHIINGVVFEPVSVGAEIDPVCHLRIGLLGAFGWAWVGKRRSSWSGHRGLRDGGVLQAVMVRLRSANVIPGTING